MSEMMKVRAIDKTQVDSDRGYSPALLALDFDARLHRIIPLGEERSCDCNSRLPLNYFHITGDPAQTSMAGNRLVNVKQGSERGGYQVGRDAHDLAQFNCPFHF